MGFGNDLATDQAVFFLAERQLLLLVGRAGHRCRDRRRVQGQCFALVEKPDPQPRLAAILLQQRLQAEITFLEDGPAMGPLGFALFVVLAIGMAFVIIVTRLTGLAVMLAVAMALCLGVATMTVAIAFDCCRLGFAAALKDEGSCANPQCEDDGNGDQVFFAGG